MKALLLALCSCFLASSQGAPAPIGPAALTNKDILAMHLTGLTDQILIAKIDTSPCLFDTGPNALSELKNAGINEGVILAMIAKPVGGPTSDGAVHDAVRAGGAGSPSSDPRAVLHFYRERAFTGSLRKMPVYIDGVKVADLVNGRQFSTPVDPGKHVFRCQTKDDAIQVNIESGRQYYLRAELVQSFTKNHWRIVQMSDQQGELDVERLKPLDPTDILPVAQTQN
jgi:hypothetical protein